MNIIFDNNENELIIKVSGRLDTSSANEFDEKVNDVINGKNKVIIDFKDLEYISSSGLRCILKIKKIVNDLEVINVNNDIYDIFQMTGFSEMIKIKKLVRSLSVKGCEVVGIGACGTVYRISSDTIVKVYKPEVSLEIINRERELARRAFILGVPTAIPYDIVDVDGSIGTVFELLNANTIQKEIIDHPDNFDNYLKLYCDVLKTIHNSVLKPGELTSAKSESLKWIEKIKNVLGEDYYKKALTLVTNINDDNHMIHGDYHVKNLMIQNGEPFIIDMDTISTGSPIFEYAYMYSCYYAYDEIEKGDCSRFLGIKQEFIDKLFYTALYTSYPELKDENNLNNFLKKARILSYIQIIERFIRTKKGEEIINHFVNNLKQLLNEVNDLNV